MTTTMSTSNTAIGAVSPWLSGTAIDNTQFGHTISCTSDRELAAHEHLFLEGEKQSHIYFVVEGVVGMYKLLADGRRQISTFAYPGDVIGLDTIDAHVNSAEALVSSKLRCIPVVAIEKLMRNEPGFGQALLYLTATELADTREQMLSLGRKSAAEKLATFLLRISKRSQMLGHSGDMLSIPMKRSEIADFLGLTIETVSRTFTKFKVSGVIRLQTNSEVKILDLDQLTMIASGQASSMVH